MDRQKAVLTIVRPVNLKGSSPRSDKVCLRDKAENPSKLEPCRFHCLEARTPRGALMLGGMVELYLTREAILSFFLQSIYLFVMS